MVGEQSHAPRGTQACLAPFLFFRFCHRMASQNPSELHRISNWYLAPDTLPWVSPTEITSNRIRIKTKLVLLLRLFMLPSNRIRIETCQDRSLVSMSAPSEITSNRIRIETTLYLICFLQAVHIWNNIQQNKDWNQIGTFVAPVYVAFLNYIQQNKDWKFKTLAQESHTKFFRFFHYFFIILQPPTFLSLDIRKT